MTSVLVIGGSGFLGSHLVPSLLERGYSVTVQDLIPKDAATKLKDVADRIEYKWKSLVDMNLGDVMHDVIINLAAQADVPLAISSPRYTWEQNLAGNLTLLEALREARKGGADPEDTILMSSESVYGEVPPEHLPITEDEYPHPTNAYGASKVAVEALAYAYSNQFHLPITILRSTTMFGERSRLKQVIPIFITQALNDKPITIEGDGTQSRDFTYVGNTVQGIIDALDHAHAHSKFRLYNIGSGIETTIGEMATNIIELTHSKSQLSYVPWRPGEKGLRLKVSIDRAKKEIGYLPPFRMVDGLERTIAWMRTQVSK